MFSKSAQVNKVMIILCAALLLVGCNKCTNPYDASQSTSTIVYCDDADGCLYTYNLSTGEKKNLIKNRNGIYSSPACSHDGKRFAFDFHSDSLHNVFSLNTINTDGSNMKTLSTLSSGGWFEEGCSWSPDGSMIAFTKPSTPFNPFLNTLCIINADGTGEHVVAASCIAVMGWNPWFGSVLFVRLYPNLPAGEFYSVNPDGSNLQRFMGVPLVQSVAWTADPNLVYVSILDSASIGSSYPREDAWLLRSGDKISLKQITHGQLCRPLYVVSGGSQLLCLVIDDTSDWHTRSLYLYDTSGKRLRRATGFKGEVSAKLSPSKDEIAFE